MSSSVRHFLDISELPPMELRNMLALGADMKARRKAHDKGGKPLEGKTLAMIFERPSTRTRVSFDVGMRQLGGGFPIGAVLATAEAASGMTPGSHGSTFGGNPLAIAAANAVLDVMLKPGFFDHVQKMSLLLKQKLASVVDRYPTVLSEVRGEGLLVGVKAVVPSGDLVNALRDEKLLTVGAGDNVVRFLAPLIVTEAEIDESVQMLERACVALSANQLKKAAG